MRAYQIIFLIMLIASVSILAFATPGIWPVSPLGANPHRLSFGSSGIGTNGWLMPPNTLVQTSHTANHTLSGFVEGTFNVFPYHVLPDTKIYLGLYLNGQLVATREYDSPYNYNAPATILGNVVNGAANFTDSMLVFNVSLLDLSKTLPSGTIMTLTAWVSKPLWVQIDRSSPTHSYETLGLVAYSPPSVVDISAGIIAPYTLSVWFETNE